MNPSVIPFFLSQIKSYFFKKKQFLIWYEYVDWIEPATVSVMSFYKRWSESEGL